MYKYVCLCVTKLINCDQIFSFCEEERTNCFLLSCILFILLVIVLFFMFEFNSCLVNVTVEDYIRIFGKCFVGSRIDLLKF